MNSQFIAKQGLACLLLLPLAGCIIEAPAPPQHVYGTMPPAAIAAPVPAGVYQPPPPPSQEQPEVLTRGPVHEAFAEPVNIATQAGLVAPRPPPPAPAEVPPEERPAGAGYVWIPGYWSWDAERADYIWVSACWRLAPANMVWVPGYWTPVTEGCEWVAGFWTPAGAQQIEYLPAPPAAFDVAPVGMPPVADDIWVPGCWYWRGGAYARRAGYWLHPQPGWCWAPAHYGWTPRGYVLAEGYWDYALERRGILFAPVYFPRSVYSRPGFSYSPSIVLDLGVLSVSLFAYPRYSHYYFGDYYADMYLGLGIYPWFHAGRHDTWYDPLFEYGRWQHRGDRDWERRERERYDVRRRDRDLRPPRTYRELQARGDRQPAGQVMARPLHEAVAHPRVPMKFERVTQAGRQKIAGQAASVGQYRDARGRWESAATPVQAGAPLGPPKAAPGKKVGVRAPEPAHRAPAEPPTRPVHVPTPLGPAKNVAPPPSPASVTSREQPRHVQPAYVPPRQVRVTQPERVTVPASPVVGSRSQSAGVGNGPPAAPANEGRRPSDGRDRDSRGDDRRRR